MGRTGPGRKVQGGPLFSGSPSSSSCVWVSCLCLVLAAISHLLKPPNVRKSDTEWALKQQMCQPRLFSSKGPAQKLSELS